MKLGTDSRMSDPDRSKQMGPVATVGVCTLVVFGLPLLLILKHADGRFAWGAYVLLVAVTAASCGVIFLLRWARQQRSRRRSARR